MDRRGVWAYLRSHYVRERNLATGSRPYMRASSGRRPWPAIAVGTALAAPRADPSAWATSHRAAPASWPPQSGTGSREFSTGPALIAGFLIATSKGDLPVYVATPPKPQCRGVRAPGGGHALLAACRDLITPAPAGTGKGGRRCARDSYLGGGPAETPTSVPHGFGQPTNGRSRLSSSRAIERRWTASGPSAMRRLRAQA